MTDSHGTELQPARGPGGWDTVNLSTDTGLLEDMIQEVFGEDEQTPPTCEVCGRMMILPEWSPVLYQCEEHP